MTSRHGWLVCVCTLVSACFSPTDLTGDDTAEGSDGSTGVTGDTNPSTTVSSATGMTSEATLTGTTVADSSDSGSDSVSASATQGTSSDTATASGSTGGSSSSGGETGEPIACDLFAPECPEGFKCNAFADDGGSVWNASQCFPLDPTPEGIGDACTMTDSVTSGIDDCEEGSLCFDFEGGDLVGACTAYCGGSPDDPTCPGGTTCTQMDNDAVVFLCLTWCDPLLQDCAGGQACYPTEGGGFVCAPDASMGAGHGDDCSFTNGCPAGMFCAASPYVPDCMGIGCCTTFCDITDPTNNCIGQAGGEECLPFFDNPPPGFEDVGVCIIPP